MHRKYAYIIFGLTLLSCFLIFAFFIGNRTEQAAQNVQVVSPPFHNYISGTGIVEPASKNIAISSPFNRTVEKINVSVNNKVKKGEVLFELYNQDYKANFIGKQKKYEESLSNFYKLQTIPRKEDLILAQQMLKRARAAFNEARIEYWMAIRRARSVQEKRLSYYKYQQAEADFIEAQVQFDKVQSGTWMPELKMAQAAMEQAFADMKAVEADLAQTYIKSPIDGTVLQINIQEGETLDPSKTAIMLGDIDALNLRVSIDQFNALRFQPNSPAVAYKQGDSTAEFPLKYLYLEPVMVPKKYLTNSVNERVDTQTFEVLYRIEKTDSHLFIGEQMDVFISAEENRENQ